MIRKIAILMPMFFLFLGLDNCNSPEAPKEPKYEYRYNVEVIYTSPPHPESDVEVVYTLNDPSVDTWGEKEYGDGQMEYIGENKYRYYLKKVFIQTPSKPTKHEIFVQDHYNHDFTNNTGENIEVEGACELEIYEIDPNYTVLKFRMSKE